MTVRHWTRALWMLACLWVAACTVVPDPVVFERHAFVVTPDGNLKVPNLTTNDEAARQETPYLEVTDPTQFPDRFRKITRSLKESGRKRILIFIHGGLNSLSDSTDRVNRLYPEILRDSDYYPVFINWDSGLIGSYGEHLVFVRQGETAPTIGIPSAPFYGLYDLGRSLVRAPITWGYTAYNDAGAPEFIPIEAERNARSVYEHIRKDERWPLSRGRSKPFGLSTIGNGVWYGITWPIQFTVAPFVDGFGASGWQNQLRRAKTVFERTAEFDVRGKESEVHRVLQQRQTGAVSVFFRTLQQELGADSAQYRITLVGHSMGVIISNEVLQRFDTLPVEHIVYMAGADSVANTLKATVPFLRNSNAAQLYLLSLHPNNEKAEMNLLGVAPRGSLLVWLDNYFTTPETQLDRTVGNWDNVMQTIGQFPPELMPRVHVKAFDEDSCITQHGDFSDAPFWRPAFWLPGPHNQNPCP